MTTVEERVSQCFLNVFPDIAPSDLPRASQAGLPEWDSLAHVILLSAISEEFQIEVDDDAVETLTSYLLVVDYVESQVAA